MPDIKESNQLIDGSNTITQDVGPPCNVISPFLEESVHNTTKQSPIIQNISTPCKTDASDTTQFSVFRQMMGNKIMILHSGS